MKLREIVSKRKSELEQFRNLELAQGSIDDARGDLHKCKTKKRKCLDCGAEFLSEGGLRICENCHEDPIRNDIDSVVEGE